MENQEIKDKIQPVYRFRHSDEWQEFPSRGIHIIGPDGKKYKMEFDVEGRLVVTACALSPRMIVYPCCANQIALQIEGE